MKKILIIYFICLIKLTSFAQFFKLHDFEGISTGARPSGSLLFDGLFLYGTTTSGGLNNNGTIFKINSNTNELSKLFDFSGTNSGSNPNGTLIYDGSFLYGMTTNGGVYNNGTIFKIKPDGTEYFKLLDFDHFNNGSGSSNTLMYEGNFLYGTTSSGGYYAKGTVFKIMTNGNGYQKLLDFNGANGKYPTDPLISDGTFLYGMTTEGGENNMGVIYKIMTNGTDYSKLFDFSGANNGSSPFGSLTFDSTYLYGMTYYGGTNNSGTIFKIMTNGSGFLKLLDFSETTNGYYPRGSLIFDGTFLYGLTEQSYTTGYGTIFKIKPNGSEYSNLFNFNSIDGQNPRNSLIIAGISLYGTSFQGGTNNFGTIYKYSPSTLSISSTEIKNKLNIFPNPTKSILNVQTPNHSKLEKVIITDLMGKTIFEKTLIENQINIENLENGIYFIEAYSNENKYQTKFIKE